jgi:DNA-binding response OmpR family regulator
MRTGFDSGCNDYLTKPVNSRDLLDMVNRYLASQEVS